MMSYCESAASSLWTAALPGFAAVVGAAPDKETAVKIAQELQLKNLYVFMASAITARAFPSSSWMREYRSAGIRASCPSARKYPQRFSHWALPSRAAMAFGGVKPGDFRKNLIYNKDRIFAFVLACGFVTDEWYANAAGCINYGFPS